MMNPHDELAEKKVSFYTLGCRLNFSETGTLVDGFKKRGFEVVPFGEEADVVFLNTCTVTDAADSTCRNLIRRAQRSSPEGKIIVSGCYAQMDPEAISKINGVDLILGNSEKFNVFHYLDEDKGLKVKIDRFQDFWPAFTSPDEVGQAHTRGFLKIQDGCNYICSFCIIPFARGRSRSIKIAKAIENAREMVAKGLREIVLTGVNIGEFENDRGESLPTLLKELSYLDGLERIRLSSVEPNTITDKLLETMASSPKFMDHFHLPLQSGDPEILKAMRRKYTIEEYSQTLKRVKEFFPHAGIGADVIVGFPGESEDSFKRTYEALSELPLTHLHVFPYSKRKGTQAIKLAAHIQHQEKKRRGKIINDLGEAKLLAFAESQKNRVHQVLVESNAKKERLSGHTNNFIKVIFPKNSELRPNQIVSVQLEDPMAQKAQNEEKLGAFYQCRPLA